MNMIQKFKFADSEIITIQIEKHFEEMGRTTYTNTERCNGKAMLDGKTMLRVVFGMFVGFGHGSKSTPGLIEKTVARQAV